MVEFQTQRESDGPSNATTRAAVSKPCLMGRREHLFGVRFRIKGAFSSTVIDSPHHSSCRCEQPSPPPTVAPEMLGPRCAVVSHLQGDHGLQALMSRQLSGEAAQLSSTQSSGPRCGEEGTPVTPADGRPGLGRGTGLWPGPDRTPHRHFGSLKGTQLIKVSAEGRQELAHLGGWSTRRWVGG